MISSAVPPCSSTNARLAKITLPACVITRASNAASTRSRSAASPRPGGATLSSPPMKRHCARFTAAVARSDKPLTPPVKDRAPGGDYRGLMKPRIAIGVVAFFSIGVALVAPMPWLLGLVSRSAGDPPLVEHLLGRYVAAHLVFLAHVGG